METLTFFRHHNPLLLRLVNRSPRLRLAPDQDRSESVLQKIAFGLEET